MIRRRLEAQRSARGEFLEFRGALEIGAGSAKRNAGAAKCRGAASKIILPQNAGRALVPCIAPANREAQLFGEIIGEVGKNRIGFGVDIGFGKGGQTSESGKQADIEQCVGLGIEIVEANQAVELVALVKQLEFLADLFVPIQAGNVQIDRRQRVKINRRCRVVLAPGADRPEGNGVAQIGSDVHRHAISFDILDRVIETAACVKYIGKHRRAGNSARNQAMTATGVAFVFCIVAGDPYQNGFAIAAKFKRTATGPDVLVVIF